MKRCIYSLNQELPKTWIVGAAWLFEHPNSMLTTIIPALDNTGIAENPDSDLRVRDSRYQKVAEKLFNNLKQDKTMT